MQELIYNLKNEALALITQAKNLKEVEELKVIFLGRKGKINNFLDQIIKLKQGQEKTQLAKLLNEVKQVIKEALENKKQSFASPKENFLSFDPTLPGEKPKNWGHLHPLSQAIEEITEIFQQIGFICVRYPEVEWDWYAFEALNMPKNHPARDEWETFFIDLPPDSKKGAVVLTPHTSSGQVREMERLQAKPPIRMLNIGKCYRRQNDLTHVPMFHQFEGLVIDKGINITHLKGVLDYFAQQWFGQKVKSRIRPFHFQFTEPSFEVDFSCVNCQGRGCRFCKGGWHEVGGSGMVHPNVLKAGGINPLNYSGFAFGWGIERLLALRYQLDDIRILYENDLRFLEQF